MPLGWERALRIVFDFDIGLLDLLDDVLIETLCHLLVDKMKERWPFSCPFDNGESRGFEFFEEQRKSVEDFFPCKLGLIPLFSPEADDGYELFDLHIGFACPHHVGAEQVVQIELRVLR